MTIDEVCRSFHIDRETLQTYERTGLLECGTDEKGRPHYSESALRRLGMIHSLLNAGIEAVTLERNPVLLNEDGNIGERVMILRRQRCRLLEDIHARQQSLDSLDYLIRQIKKEGAQR
ncbi:MerR family transcriptional regulator [Cloacibacillus sp.]